MDVNKRVIAAALAAGVLGVCLLLGGCDKTEMSKSDAAPKVKTAEEGVTVAEDLMREHGVLRRVLMIYQECARRLDAGEELPGGTVRDSAEIVRTFIEGYHEKLEEDYLFPRFEQAGVQLELVKTLRSQHEAGRTLTADIMRLTVAPTIRESKDREALARDMREFIAMYQPHAAREDTVLFPAIRSVCGPGQYETLGDVFEDKEHELFGEGGFEKMVDRVAAIEKSLGIYDLARFTPNVAGR